MVQCLGEQEGKLHQSVELGFSVLCMLGEDFPRKPKLWHIIKELLKVRRVLKGQTDDDLLDLPPMEDKDRLACMTIMNSITFATFADEDSKIHFALIALRMMTMTCLHGHTTWSPSIFAKYGGIEAASGNVEAAHRFQDLFRRLVARLPSKQAENRGLLILHGLLSQWYESYPTALEGSRKGYVIGMECGDFDYALYNANHYICFALFSRVGLTQIENDASIFCQQMLDFKLNPIWIVTLPMWQLSLNLIGYPVDDRGVLSGEELDLEQFQAHLGNGNLLAKQILIVFRTLLALIFDRYDILEELFTPFVSGRDKVFRGHFTNFSNSFYEGIMSYRLYHHTKKRKYRKQGRLSTKRLHKWVDDGVLDCIPVAACLRAEQMVVEDKKRRNKPAILREYRRAIVGAQELGVWQWEAMFHERVFQILAEIYGDVVGSELFLKQAVSCYDRWEAFSKVEWLKQVHGRFLNGY